MAGDTDLSPDNNSTLGGAGDRTRYVYDGFDRLTRTTDAEGNEHDRAYDMASNLRERSLSGPEDHTASSAFRLLHRGRLPEQGSHEELVALDGGIYRTLYQLQAAGA